MKLAINIKSIIIGVLVFVPSMLSAQSFCSGPGNDALLFSYQKNTFFRGYPNKEYQPQEHSHCLPEGYLSSEGHRNTGAFNNGICLLDFWSPGAYGGAGIDPEDSVFYPGHPGNIFIEQEIPTGTKGNISSFCLETLQKSTFTGNHFQTIGIGIYRNGVLIDTFIRPYIVGTTCVEFPNSSMYRSDGSSDVTFRITFGLVKRLVRIKTGFGLIELRGYCGSTPSTPPTIAAVPGTCSGTTANDNHKIKLTGVFDTAWHYDISVGSTYTGGKDYASATAVAVDGVLVDTLDNPAISQDYTVRFFSDDTCYIDVTETIYSTICPCIDPNANTVTAVKATCTGSTPNADAKLSVVAGSGDAFGFSTGLVYTGPVYDSATSIDGSKDTIVPNPAVGKAYTVRIFSGGNSCYQDISVTLREEKCTGCDNASLVLIASDNEDVDGANDAIGVDICNGSDVIDIRITKEVSPSTGTVGVTDFTYTLKVYNDSSLTAHSLLIKDIFSGDSLLNSSATASAGVITRSGYWSIDSLEGGDSAIATMVFKAMKKGIIRNCVALSKVDEDGDPNSSPNNPFGENDDDCVNITVTGSNLPEITKTFGSDDSKTGVPISLIFQVTNHEDTNIVLSADFVDKLPNNMEVDASSVLVSNIAGVVAIPGTDEIRMPSGTVLAPGNSRIELSVISNVSGTYCNVIAVGDLETSAGDNIDSSSTCVNLATSNPIPPKVTKSFTKITLVSGQSANLIIEIRNDNIDTITTMLPLTDYFPNGMTVAAGSVSTTCGGTVTAGVGDTTAVLNTGAKIASGTCTVTVPVTASVVATYCNRINQNALVGDINGSMISNDNRSIACLDVIASSINDLALSIKLSDGQSQYVDPGDTVCYDIEVFNQGTTDASSVTVYSYLPSDMTFGTNPSWVTVAVDKFSFDFPGTILSGAFAIVKVKMVMKPTFAGTDIDNFAEIFRADFGSGVVASDVDGDFDGNPSDDAGAIPQTTTDNQLFGDGTGASGSADPLVDDDDHDVSEITLKILGSLGDYVWLDVNNDGLQSGGEPPVQNVKVYLWDNLGTLLDSTTTDVTGLYLFSNLEPQGYKVEVILPDNYRFTSRSNSNTTDGSDVSLETGFTLTHMLGNGENHLDLDAGLLDYLTVGDYVWYDDINNGVQDGSEPGVSGVVVELYDNVTSLLVATETTDASGFYLFDTLDPGSYYINFSSLPAGYKFAYQNAGSNDSIDSDADTTTGNTTVFTLNFGDHPRIYDAGILLNGITPVPVDLLYLTGVWEGKNAMIRWATATETNNSHFEIERSLDGINYEYIGKMKSKSDNGNSQAILNYEMMDISVKPQVQEVVYYKLFQIDLDGTRSSKGVVVLLNSPLDNLVAKAWPVPTTDNVTLLLSNVAANKEIKIQVFDMYGRVVVDRTATTESKVFSTPIDLSHVRSGIYKVKIINGQNVEVMSVERL